MLLFKHADFLSGHLELAATTGRGSRSAPPRRSFGAWNDGARPVAPAP